MNRVFIDSSFWITYREENEARWAEAQRIVVELFRRQTHFVTTLAGGLRNPRGLFPQPAQTDAGLERPLQ